MKDILFLAHRVPFPPDRGDKMRSYHLLRAAAAIAPVHLVCFAENAADERAADALRPMVASVYVERRLRPLVVAATQAIAHRCPISVTAFASRVIQAAVDRLVAAQPIGTIFAFSSQMAQFALPHAAGHRFVMDFVDLDSAKFADYAARGGALRAIHSREAYRLARWERMVAAAADLSLFVSDAEAQLFRAQTFIRPNRVRVLENGIDHERYDPATTPRLDPAERGAGPLIVFTGQMDYRPNVEAVAFYAHHVLPLVRRSVPDAGFAIVGRNPSRAVRRLAALPGVRVTGEVADVRGWIAAADAVAAPLGIARGVQNKVLEAMALARPVVASPAAFEGIDAVPAREIMVADSAADQAEAAVALIEDHARSDALGRAARDRVVSRYSWEGRLADFPAILGREPVSA